MSAVAFVRVVSSESGDVVGPAFVVSRLCLGVRESVAEIEPGGRGGASGVAAVGPAAAASVRARGVRPDVYGVAA